MVSSLHLFLVWESSSEVLAGTSSIAVLIVFEKLFDVLGKGYAPGYDGIAMVM